MFSMMHHKYWSSVGFWSCFLDLIGWKLGSKQCYCLMANTPKYVKWNHCFHRQWPSILLVIMTSEPKNLRTETNIYTRVFSRGETCSSALQANFCFVLFFCLGFWLYLLWKINLVCLGAKGGVKRHWSIDHPYLPRRKSFVDFHKSQKQRLLPAKI